MPTGTHRTIFLTCHTNWTFKLWGLWCVLSEVNDLDSQIDVCGNLHVCQDEDKCS